MAQSDETKTNSSPEDPKRKVQLQQNISVSGGDRSIAITFVSNGFFLLIVLSLAAGILWWGNNKPWEWDVIARYLKNRVEEVVATVPSEKIYVGYGETKEKALEEAKKEAVRIEAGEIICGETEVKESQLVRDEIISQAEGYVDEVKEVAIKPPAQSEKELWEIHIRCRVRLASIVQRVENDPKLSEFRNRRVMVMAPDSLSDENLLAAYRRMTSVIKEFLLEKGFHVFVNEMALAAFREIAGEFPRTLGPELYERVKDLPTDFLIFSHIERRESNNRPLLKVELTARNRVGTVFAHFSREYPAERLDDKSNWEQAIVRCASELNEALYHKLLQKCLVLGRSNEYTAYFQNYDNSWYDRIENVMDKFPDIVNFRVVDKGEELMYADFAGPVNIGPRLRSRLRSQGIPCEWKSMGNWIFIRKPDIWRFGISVTIAAVLLIFAVYWIIKKSPLQWLSWIIRKFSKSMKGA